VPVYPQPVRDDISREVTLLRDAAPILLRRHTFVPGRNVRSHVPLSLGH
jgi:hypothetical protein